MEEIFYIGASGPLRKANQGATARPAKTVAGLRDKECSSDEVDSAEVIARRLRLVNRESSWPIHETNS